MLIHYGKTQASGRNQVPLYPVLAGRDFCASGTYLNFCLIITSLRMGSGYSPPHQDWAGSCGYETWVLPSLASVSAKRTLYHKSLNLRQHSYSKVSTCGWTLQSFPFTKERPTPGQYGHLLTCIITRCDMGLGEPQKHEVVKILCDPTSCQTWWLRNCLHQHYPNFGKYSAEQIHLLRVGQSNKKP
jgi:hypothetical protein